MRIRILTAVAGHGFSWRRGEIVELPDALARRWCDGVRAEPVADTALPRPRRRRGGVPAEVAIEEPREAR